MSGHSHAKTIQHKKAITDDKRGRIFSKLSREISIVVKEKGGDPETNSSLRMAIERAKEFNLPKENIERAIKRGTGELTGENLEQVVFEAYGPGGIAVIIEGITDNKNRALGEIKKILGAHGGKMVAEGSIRWMFDRRGIIEVDPTKIPYKNKEEIEMLAIESGAEDICWHEYLLDIYTKPEDLEKVKKNLAEKDIQTKSVLLGWVAKDNIKVGEKDKENCQKLFEALDEGDAVQEIYSNIKE